MRFVVLLLVAFVLVVPGSASASLFLDSWGVSYNNWAPVGFGGQVNYWTEDWREGETNLDGFLGPGWGSDRFDVEAGYFGADATYYYMAVVTGFNPAGVNGFLPGDLFFDVGNDGSWDYAFDHSDGGLMVSGITGTQGAEAWPGENFGGAADPFLVTSYVGPTYAGHDYSFASFSGRYALEVRIERGVIGDFGAYKMHWTMGCGNDVVDLVGGTVPEPATLLLVGAGLAGGAASRWRRRKAA